MRSAIARRTLGVLVAVAFGGGLALSAAARQAASTSTAQSAQTGETAAAQQPPATPPPPVAPRPRSPEQQAYDGAMAMKDPFDKIEALERIRSGFPKSAFLSMVDSSLLDLLVNNCPDRLSEVGEVFDRVVRSISEGPRASNAESRLLLLQRPVTLLVDKKLHLDKAEAAVESALGSIDLDPLKFFQTEIDRAKALKQPEPTASAVVTRLKSTRGRGLELLGRVYSAKGDPRAEATLRDALAANPSSAQVALLLAGLEAKRGDDSAALDHYLQAALSLKLKADDDKAMRALFSKLRGPGADIEYYLDGVYHKMLPNPVTPTKWTASPTRSTRLVLAEAFTGSACAPCVSESLAFQALLERYPEAEVASLAYHVHIPGPDPMTTSGSAGRKLFYEVKGVPTFNVDGALVKLGGGPRDNTATVYADYVKAIDKALETPARAKMSVAAELRGDKIDVKALMSEIEGDAKGLTLHVVLAERKLRFSGENGIRFHEMVVRAMAGKDGAGLPINPADDRSIKLMEMHTFDIATIRTDISGSLEAEIAKRRKTESAAATPTATPREYVAEGKAMVDLDRRDLVVIAFLQDAKKQVLQATRTDVK
jgi:tetratricopeptide (TPR) repeat protein